MLVEPERWRPVGVDELEPTALEVVRDTSSACVIAGPGSGKTELLAQRAAFLLQTGACPAPSRVLAISFKRDAARNLADRVLDRCGAAEASRFDSYTFDSFARDLVDRFRLSLPVVWQPSPDYRVEKATRGSFRAFIQYLKDHRSDWKGDLNKLTLEVFEQRVLGTYKIPLCPERATNVRDYVVLNWLSRCIAGSSDSMLTFQVVNRLAETLLRSSQQVARALTATYPFVFVDEFQDTTWAQYDLLDAAFVSKGAAVTVVGDNKQRIMTWAGARPDAFDTIATSIGVEPKELTFNYRSAHRLLMVQHTVASSMDSLYQPAESKYQEADGSSDVAVWVSTSIEEELDRMASKIEEGVSKGRTHPDFAILVKQKADDFAAGIVPVLAERGIKVVNLSHEIGEVSLQDLLKDRFVQFALALIRLSFQVGDPDDWASVRSTMMYVRQADDDDIQACSEIEEKIDNAKDATIRRAAEEAPTARRIDDVLHVVEMLVTELEFVQAFREYGAPGALSNVRAALRGRMLEIVDSCDTWQEIPDAITGKGRVQLMTIHKSKGLEFQVVFVLGLDDRTWWSYADQPQEARAAFFVAISRAREELYLQHCAQRGGRAAIDPLFKLLEDANVPVHLSCSQGDSGVSAEEEDAGRAP